MKLKNEKRKDDTYMDQEISKHTKLNSHFLSVNAYGFVYQSSEIIGIFPSSL